MKTYNRLLHYISICLLLELVTTQKSFGQTNIQFISFSSTIEQAIQLTWTSTNHEMYEIEEADALNTNSDGTTEWNKLYDSYPSQGTNTFWLDTGNYNLSPQILHPKYMPMRFYRIVDEGPDTTSDEPSVYISSPTNASLVNGELTITVTAFTDQPVLSGTKLYVNGQEMQMADSTTNYVVGSTNYEVDTYTINTCEWPNGTNILFATTECESGYGDVPNSGPIASGHAVSAFVPVNFNNLVGMISFSQSSFDPSSGQTQQVSAVFAVNADWTLYITDINSNVVQSTSGSGTSMSYNWDGTGFGETNLPNGIYYYYFTAQTNSESFEEGMVSRRFSSFGAAADSGTEIVEVPLPPMPPGLASDDAPQTMLVERPMVALTVPSPGDGGGSSGSPASPSMVYTTPLPSPQNPPPTPQRPPNNPIKGLAGTFGIAYDTYNENSTNGVNTPALQNEPGIPGSYIQMATNSASSSLNWGARPQHIAEANTFVGQMEHYGWSNPLNEADGQLSISSLRGSGTPFNNVNMGVLMLHGTYGNTQDYMAGLCKQMYFVVTSGGSGQYLRFSEMNLGGSGASGLKWMVLDPCFSLYHANWSSMQNAGIKPYNSNLHLILGAVTETWTSRRKWYNFAKYMNYGSSTNYSPLTIRNAYYQGNQDAFRNAPLPAGTTITLTIAGDSACFSDTLQTTNTPSGTWIYDTPVTVFSN